ncbi:MAG TPA: 2-dehydropantoate 2-reductase [Hyphomicrobiaceae bacterium]|nr:2-dehydropantoate 2-reductase [Hyphomicrobiaceae bacterium]
MKIVVMGAGGVGGYFGARLAAAHHDVTFVARGAHLEAMRRAGLRLDSDIGALAQPVKVAAEAHEIAAAECIIFAVKLGDTEAAADQLRGLVAGGATVFTFQNGVESAERIGYRLGPENVVPGVARISAQISAPGVITQRGKFASLEFGEPDRAPRPRAGALLEACKGAGISAAISPDIARALWLKFAMLAPMSGLTALTRGPIGPVRADPQARQLLEAAVREVVALGMAAGVRLEPADADAVITAIDALHPGIMASMCHDLLAQKKLEIAGLSGAVVRLGRARGVAVPTHTFITQALSLFADGKPKLQGSHA